MNIFWPQHAGQVDDSVVCPVTALESEIVVVIKHLYSIINIYLILGTGLEAPCVGVDQ